MTDRRRNQAGSGVIFGMDNVSPWKSGNAEKDSRPLLRAILLTPAVLRLLTVASTIVSLPASSLEAQKCETGDSQRVVVVVGAPGTPDYQSQFHIWADRWQQTAGNAGATHSEIGRQDDENLNDREQLQQLLSAQVESSQMPLWLILIGHGTFYRDLAKFNLRGLDVSAQELATWLEPVERPLVIVNCASCSGPFINRLSASDRVIVTATRSGAEQNFARFGDYFSQAIADTAADLDHDKEVSLLEAFLSASGQVAKFYEQESRLATEHALLDDNGDSLGTPATFFRGIHAIRSARDGADLDGARAGRIGLVSRAGQINFSSEQLAARSEIELSIDGLRSSRSTMDETAYYEQLEPLMIRLAQLYEEVENTHGDVEVGN